MIPRFPEGAAILSAAAMRASEAAAFGCGVAQSDLMECAGLAVAREAHRLASGLPLVVVAGPGNNGGDAYVAVRFLVEWGHDVTLAALGRPSGGAAAEMADRWDGPTIEFSSVQAPAGDYVLVDGLFGTGVSRALQLSSAQRRLFEKARYRVAIDQPSHVATDSGGRLWDAPAATLTVSFAALKPLHLLAREACGQVVLADIGISRFVSSDWTTLARPDAATPLAGDHKYRSRVTVVAGAMPGAARLAARGAVGAGAGYVILLGDAQAPLDAVIHRPSGDLREVLSDERGRVVVGPGLGRDSRAHDILDAALASRANLVLDGDALTLLGEDAIGRLRARDADTVLTPHEGEFDRMFGAGRVDKITRTIAACDATGATIVHKGAATVIAKPGGAVRVSAEGASWLATAGTGDVLAGAIASRGAEAGVWLHARASRLAGPAFSADRLADVLPRAVGSAR